MVIFSFNKSPISKHSRTLNLRKARAKKKKQKWEQMNKKTVYKKEKVLDFGEVQGGTGSSGRAGRQFKFLLSCIFVILNQL